MLKILRVSDMIGLKVFTDSGDFLGMIEEANIVNNKIDSWRVKISRDSTFVVLLGGARGLVIPHQYVKAISEVVLISRAAIPSKEEIRSEEVKA